MGTKMDQVLWFSDIEKEDGHVAGIAGVKLGQLMQAKFPVPQGFVIPAGAYHTFIKHNNLQVKIKHLLATADFHRPESLLDVSSSIKKHIMHGELPEQFVTTIFQAYRRLGGVLQDTPVAILPSPIIHSPSHQNTYILKHVFFTTTGESNVILKIKEIWASLFEPKAIMGRQDVQLNHFQSGIAVVVQKIMPADREGIMYTSDPITKDRSKIIIETGQAPNIAHNQNNHYEISKRDILITKKVIGDTTTALSTEQTLSLGKLGKHLEQYFYFPQEIHWVLTNNQPYISQSLPMRDYIHKPTISTPSETSNPHNHQAKKMHVATKIYTAFDQPNHIANLASDAVDGVILHGESVFSRDNTFPHPKKLIHEGKPETFIHHCVEHMKPLVASLGSRPLIYRPADVTSELYRSLPSGKQFEPQEKNPLLGYHGAFRIIHDPAIFLLEMEAIKELKNTHDAKNIWLMLPFIRSVHELVEIKKIISSVGLYRSPSFKLILSIDLPGNIPLLEKFIHVGIDGIFINTDTLSTFMLAADPQNDEVASLYDQQIPSMLWACEQVIPIAHKQHIPVSIYGKALSLYPTFLESCIRLGAAGVAIYPEHVEATRQLIAQEERKLIN